MRSFIRRKPTGPADRRRDSVCRTFTSRAAHTINITTATTTSQALRFFLASTGFWCRRPLPVTKREPSTSLSLRFLTRVCMGIIHTIVSSDQNRLQFYSWVPGAMHGAHYSFFDGASKRQIDFHTAKVLTSAAVPRTCHRCPEKVLSMDAALFPVEFGANCDMKIMPRNWFQRKCARFKPKGMRSERSGLCPSAVLE